MSALEALKLIAPTAHLERRGGVEGGAEGSGAGREASFTVQDLAANSALPSIEQKSTSHLVLDSQFPGPHTP